MGKGQRTLSFPKIWMEWIDKIYDEHKKALIKLEITSPSELVRVLANFGKPELERVLRESLASKEAQT